MESKKTYKWKCVDCGIEFEVATSTNIRYKQNERIPRCKKCRLVFDKKYQKELYNNLTDEEKNDRKQIQSTALKQMWNSFSDKKRQSIRNSQKRAIADMDPNKRAKQLLKIKKAWNDKTEDELKDIYEKRRKCAIVRWDNEEFRNNVSKKIKDNWIRMLNELKNIHDEEKKSMSSQYLSFDEMCLNRSQKVNNNTYEISKNTEKIFSEYLSKIYISYKYKWYNTPNPKECIIFHKQFPLNPITNSNFVSAFHEWDFKLSFPYNSIIYIDIDGSEHFMSSWFGMKHNKKVDVSELIKFNDSQRPYQTDGNKCYVIECPDDILHDDCIVRCINDNTIYSYKVFKQLLEIMNKKDNKEG